MVGRPRCGKTKIIKMVVSRQQVLQKLDQASITYQLIEHPPVFTAKQADQYVQGYVFERAKNLFLKTVNNKKFFLLLILENDRLDFKRFRDLAQTSRVTMASSEDLLHKLGLKPGAVSPFGLLNDPEKDVELDIQQKLLEKPFIGVHPNDNQATLILKTEELISFFKNNGYIVKILDL